MHCTECGRSLIEPIDFDEASRRALKVSLTKDDEIIGVSANAYGLWSVRILRFTGMNTHITEKTLNIKQE